MVFPDYWIEFISKNHLTGATILIQEATDRSGVGARLEFLSAEDSMDEAENFWPGIGVSKDGYVPVGSCEYGSGDPYFIRKDDGKDGPLYRIYHDAVGDDGYDPKDAIAVVLENYQDLLNHLEKC